MCISIWYEGKQLETVGDLQATGLKIVFTLDESKRAYSYITDPEGCLCSVKVEETAKLNGLRLVHSANWYGLGDKECDIMIASEKLKVIWVGIRSICHDRQTNH